MKNEMLKNTVASQHSIYQHLLIIRNIRKKVQRIISKKENDEVKVEKLLSDSASFNEEDDSFSTSPYPVGTNPKQSQAFKSFRPSINPRKTSIILFPGQGVQYVGMNKKVMEYPQVREMFQFASEVMKLDMSLLCEKGPRELLDKTENCQMAMLLTNLAAVCKLQEERPWAVENCIACAGFSVGEIAALVFAGGITFEDAVELVSVRGRAMQEASEKVRSGMMTIFYGADAKIGFACEVATQWCKQHGVTDAVCSIANFLYPGCKVLGGNEEALDFIMRNKEDFGIKRCKPLPVSGAFHTTLMGSAVLTFKKTLSGISLSDPKISVHCNINGNRYVSAEHILKMLPKQICSSLRWEQIMHVLYERNPGQDFPNTYECGPGKSLCTILKYVNRRAHEFSYSTLFDDQS